MTLNIPLAQQVLAQIEAHPDQHVQRNWASSTPCGTAYCMAGWAIALSGYTFEFDEDNGIYDRLKVTGPDGTVHVDFDHSHQVGGSYQMGGVATVQRLGKDLLGLTDDEASALFYELNEGVAVQRLSSWIDHAVKLAAARSSALSYA